MLKVSHVVHCVRASLAGTTVAPFGVHWSLVADWFARFNSLCILFVVMGAL